MWYFPRRVSTYCYGPSLEMSESRQDTLICFGTDCLNSPTENNPWELDLTRLETRKRLSTPNPPSTTAGNLPRCVLKLLCPATASTSQLEAQLRRAPVGRLPESFPISDQPACLPVHNISDDTRQNADTDTSVG
jgi:hypothetical protein